MGRRDAEGPAGLRNTRSHEVQENHDDKKCASEEQYEAGNEVVKTGLAFEGGPNVAAPRHRISLAREEDEQREENGDNHPQNQYDVVA